MPMKAAPTAATVAVPPQEYDIAATQQVMEETEVSITDQPATPAPAKKDWRDPHSISSELDEQTSEAIIQRLESRGKDQIFRSLFDTYFPQLVASCKNVLEIGAGTGVICRALAAQGFQGRLLGIDQSPVFIEAAKKFSAQEGYSPGHVDFKVCDARTLSRADLGDFVPDAIIMHTLISHVDDPGQALRTARALAPPGALLVLVDGDYLGLHYHSNDNPELSETMSRALVEATFASPGVVRALPKLLTTSGWRLESASGKCVSEFGGEFSYWKSFAEAYMPRVKGSGRVAPELVDSWWADQKNLAQEEQFLAACTYYTLFAKANSAAALSAKL
jgi:2-polyprenyl-3-methyl-5-hydroxy-6-metoxy-1,4-benzoquinol methylase